VGQLESCAAIHRRSPGGLLNSRGRLNRPQDESCPRIVQIIVPLPLTAELK